MQKICLVIYILISIHAFGSDPINYYQVKGTHNSYRKKGLLSLIVPSLRYHHKSLIDQLNNGVRQFELDLHYNIFKKFRVSHINIIDQRSHCKRIQQCLNDMLKWSKDNPDHFPVTVWFELKDRDLDRFLPWWKRIRKNEILKLEKIILSYMNKDKLIKPSDVMINRSNLRDSVTNYGWPSLNDSRGKFLFVIWNPDIVYALDYYNNETYEKLFFIRATSEQQDHVAFFKYDDPLAYKDVIKDLVLKNFMVSTNINNITKDDRYNFSRQDAGIESGAHTLSSDLIYQQPWTGLKYWFDDFYKPKCNYLFPNCSIE